MREDVDMDSWTRRDALGALVGSAAARLAADGGLEIAITSISPQTVRISIQPVENGRAVPVPSNGCLARENWGQPAARIRDLSRPRTVPAGELTVKFGPDPLSIEIAARDGRQVQRLRVDPSTALLAFPLGDGPVLGFGEGGPQFDRRGAIDPMRSGQGGYRLRTHGGRVPVPWLIGTSGWALFINQPAGAFDLTGPEARFTPGEPKLPLDFFVIGAREPAEVMAEFARLTGPAEMPPLWSLGYQQSHRTLASREEILSEARTFREKKLPCDTLIYLGTGFCPSGWNTGHGSFTFNPSVFPDPKEMIQRLHAQHFKLALHVVIQAPKMRGTVRDKCDPAAPVEEQASCYWNAHREVFGMGVDGWWPDEGDPLDIASRLTRNRMYWEGPQLDRPNQRPYALHRNGYAGMQRFASFLWSGDVFSTWETLATQIPVGINTGLTGIPYWGTDIGGFVPTREFTAELYVRWFQFGAFCPLFRSHGRAWKLRLPWGWNTGDLGPSEINNYGEAAVPDPSELHNAQVEPICRQYLELRYRLLPYLYSAVHECCETGLPIMRALWLHYPDDAAAVARGDEYLWGRDILVAPVTEKGATSRRLYLPRGAWCDYWTNEKQEGGREINRPVELETMPLYVRAGTVLPVGPLKQYTAETVDEPLSLVVYPGADGACTVYEDDGLSFNYRRGDRMLLRAVWNDRSRNLSLRLTAGSRMLPPLERKIEVRLAGEQTGRAVTFAGRPLAVKL